MENYQVQGTKRSNKSNVYNAKPFDEEGGRKVARVVNATVSERSTSGKAGAKLNGKERGGGRGKRLCVKEKKSGIFRKIWT